MKYQQTLIQSAEDVDLSMQKKFSAKISDLCHPISKLFNVKYFSHTRAFHNGQFTSLMTEPDLTDCFLKKKLPISFSHGKGFYLQEGHYIADCLLHESGTKEKLKMLWDAYNVRYMISIIQKNTNYDDMFSFGLDVEDIHSVSLFLNNLQMIKHFILHFKSESRGLLNKIIPVRYSNEYFASPKIHSDKSSISDEEKEVFFKSLTLKKVPVQGLLGDVLLSQREYECLSYANKSHSLKEIAQCMNLSPRTVETYLNNLKSKLGVEKRSELLFIKQ